MNIYVYVFQYQNINYFNLYDIIMDFENISDALSYFGENTYEPISATSVNGSYYGDYYDYEEREYENIAGEIALWRAVLLQSFIDLKTQSKKKRMQPIKYEAYKWFSATDQEPVRIVCQLANYNYNEVKKCANEIIEQDFYHNKKKRVVL